MIRITVAHRDGTESKAEVWASTEVAFERKFGIAWMEGFSKEYPFQEYIYFAAYHAIHEAGRTGLTFEEWVKTVAEVKLEAEDENPPKPAPQPG